MLLWATTVGAQQHDNIWLFGYSSNLTYPEYGGSVLDFSEDTIDVYYEYRDLNLDITNASICDTTGNLLFYTNGISIANAIHETMENGDGINPGELTDDYSYYGYPIIQSAIALPDPGFNDKYYLIHEPFAYLNSNYDWHAPLLYYSLIDMSINNGLGAVIEKNQVIFEDILDHGKINAVKHANGRDWWVIVLTYDSNCFRRVLITPEGIENYGIQCLGQMVPQGAGQASFSPDGSKYALYNIISPTAGNFLNIYDFDRCTGELSNPIQEVIIDTVWGGGVAFSTNSKYLYVPSYNYIYQYDVETGDIIATKDTVAIYDDFQVPLDSFVSLRTRFFLAQLAPDGKIYINCPGTVNFLHVINQPDSAGVACEVLQHHIELPTYNNSSLPNFPNYRLGVLEGSPCDTTTAVASPFISPHTVFVYPNPAFDQINLSFENTLKGDGELIIYTITGQQVSKHLLSKGQKEFNIELGSINSGIYFYEIKQNDGIAFSGKISIVK